ncbi:putative late blight resistance protein R1-A-like isoform 2 [Capsicum annuum]|nr:putative late blight resistance protein R1-A-like isoform 2 [Capsicum annuum]
MSDGPLFMTLLLRNLNDLLNSNAYSVDLIKEEIGWVKEDLEHIRLLFGNVEQELHRDLWTRVLDVPYEAEHAINSILARDRGLLQLIFLLPDIVEKVKLVKKEVQEIFKNTSIISANSPNKPVENKLSITGKIIVGFEEETEWIIRKLTSGPAELDVIPIVGMPGLGKTTLAYKVYNDKSVVCHFDVCAWCTVDQERNEKKLLQKIFNEVIGPKGRVNEDGIDNDVADKLRKWLFGKRYLIVLDDLWDTATWDELTRPFPTEFQKGSRVILTSRKKEVALHGKCHSDPLDLRLLRPEESWELLEKRVFGEEHCPDELKDVGEKIAQKCDGLPLDEEEVMKVIQLSYDHLSDHLKPCFLYLASYPKDKDIRISELKDLWSDEGLVEATDLSVEEVTEVYVDELISSSLIDSEYLYNSVSYNWHLRHLRLLKRLDVQGIILTDTVLNEIGMLVHLRFLRITMKAKALPPSFSNLCNLENLLVDNSESNLALSPTIWSLAKLRYVDIVSSLQTLGFHMDCSVAEQIYFPRLDVLNKLERVYAQFECCADTHVHQFDFHFPSSLREVNFNGLDLASDEMSRTGRSLPNLQKLVLSSASIQGGKEWKMEQVTFHNLKSLELFRVSFSEWQVTADESFPVLEELEITYCTKLIEIPESFGDIASLKFISVWLSPQLKKSALKIKEYVEEMTGEDKLEVEIGS